MCFNEIEKGFQSAFSSALRAYRRGSTAIGCAIIDARNECVATGENSIYASDNSEKINRHNLAHAEINAILKIKSGAAHVTDNILYTTMEPCIMCFGAIVMCYYKKIRFAALDPYAGAAKLNTQNNYGLHIDGPFEGLQDIQVALAVYRGLSLNQSFVSRTIEMYKDICANGVNLGKRLYADAIFTEMIDRKICVTDEELFNYMFDRV